METKFVVSNWKMNGDKGLVNSYLKKLKKYKNLIVCPPFNLMHHFTDTFKVGAQNCSEFENGAYTGEISIDLLKESGCSYALLGHSERRSYFRESNEVIQKKIELALKADIMPILCIGYQCESLNEMLEQAKVVDTRYVWLAWEPVWAIGTGKTPSKEEIISTVHFLKENTESPKVLYGGSVSQDNIQSLGDAPDGFLVGGSSLDVNNMSGILDFLSH